MVLYTSPGGTTLSWTAPAMLAAVVLGVLLLGAFLVVERRAAEPILPLSLFRNRVVAVAGAVGFVVGVALFGSVTFMPLYLQVVKGHTPTASGLLMTPMMAGVLIASITSGQLISRTGRYQLFPRLGTLVAAVGLWLLSGLEVDTPAWLAAAFMLVLGLGIGLVMQVLVLVTQNAVGYRALIWLLPQVPLRTTARAEGVGESFASPRDASSLRELERMITTLARPQERWSVYERLAGRAGLELPPPELWLLARLGERPPLASARLAAELGEDPEQVMPVLEELRRHRLVEAATARPCGSPRTAAPPTRGS